MSYQDEKCKNFSKYCNDGKIELVKKWMDNPNVDINWNGHGPMRNAVKQNKIDVINILLANPKLRTDYENDKKEIRGASLAANGDYVGGVLNPFTMAIIKKNFEILDIFIKTNRFKILREENLEILMGMKDEELNTYFMKLPGFIDFVLSVGGDYLNIFPSDAKDIFLF
jgi:hypothetical protein